MSIPSAYASTCVSRLLTSDTPAYHFSIPGDITSICIHMIPADTWVYVTADKKVDEKDHHMISWNPKHGIADVYYFNEFGEEFNGFINFQLMWQNSTSIDD